MAGGNSPDMSVFRIPPLAVQTSANLCFGLLPKAQRVTEAPPIEPCAFSIIEARATGEGASNSKKHSRVGSLDFCQQELRIVGLAGYQITQGWRR